MPDGVEVHDVVPAATKREADTTEKVTDLKSSLKLQNRRAYCCGEKHAQFEEKYSKTIENNMLFSSTSCAFDVSLKFVRSPRESLSA